MFVSLRFRGDEIGVWEVEIEHLNDGDADSFGIIAEIVLRNCAHFRGVIGFFVRIILVHAPVKRKKEFRLNSKTYPNLFKFKISCNASFS